MAPDAAGLVTRNLSRFRFRSYPSLPYPELTLKYQNVVDIYSKFEVSKRKEIEKSLVIEACADAKNQAENMASGIGEKIGSVFSISDQNMDDIGSNYMNRAFKKGMYKGGSEEESEGRSGLVFIPSVIKIQKKVHVLFKILE